MTVSFTNSHSFARFIGRTPRMREGLVRPNSGKHTPPAGVRLTGRRGGSSLNGVPRCPRAAPTPSPAPRPGAVSMHRELSHADAVFGRPPVLGLYLFTGLIGLLLGLDLLPAAAGWLTGWGVPPMPWGRELFGFRFALIAAVLGG